MYYLHHDTIFLTLNLTYGMIIMKVVKMGVNRPIPCIFVCLEMHVDNSGHPAPAVAQKSAVKHFGFTSSLNANVKTRLKFKTNSLNVY